MNDNSFNDRFLFSDENLTFSKLAIRMLRHIDSRIKEKGFRKKIFNILRNDPEGAIPNEEIDRLYWDEKAFNFIPDAYFIDSEAKVVFLFEVEDTHMLSIDKLLKIVDAWRTLDSMLWKLKVFLVDRYLSNWRILPITELYYALLSPKKNKLSNSGNRPCDWQRLYDHLLENTIKMD